MDLHGYIAFFKSHSKHLFVPLIGVAISTFSKYSLLKSQPLWLEYFVALFSCLGAILTIYVLATIIQIVDDFSSKHFSINISWLFGVSLIAVGISRAILHLKFIETQDAGLPFDEVLTFRLCALFLIAIIIIQKPEKTAKVRANKASIREAQKASPVKTASSVRGN